MPTKPDYVEIVRVDGPGAAQWRWRVKAGNNQIVATSGEKYKSEHHTLKMVKRLFPKLKVVLP